MSKPNPTLVARVAAAVVALHILDDSFFQPQPGTSAGDHLVSGLLPVAVLLAFVVYAPRLKAGLRASAAAVLGLFGVATGIEAVYYSRYDGPSGDDFTGFAALAAGLLLIAIAAWTLWTARRTGTPPLRRWVRRTLIAVGAAAALYVLVLPFLASYVLTHTARAYVPRDRLGVAHENVSFRTADGLRLRGWYVPSTNGAAVISFPGRAGTQKPARMLARHGYGVLLFDRRGEGKSDGDPNAFGWHGYRDVDAAVRYLRQRPDVKQGRIGGLGLSVGGEMMLEAAARSHLLRAVVSEGAGERSIREYVHVHGSGTWQAIPSYAALSAGTTLFTGSAPPPSLTDLVRRISPTPVFFVYGEHGQEGERSLNPTYYREAREPKLIWRVPASGHTGGIDARPVEYERRITGFFDRALLR